MEKQGWKRLAITLIAIFSVLILSVIVLTMYGSTLLEMDSKCDNYCQQTVGCTNYQMDYKTNMCDLYSTEENSIATLSI